MGKRKMYVIPVYGLKLGSKGFQVNFLQDCLNYRSKNKIEVTGVFDEKTKKRLIQFQKKQDIPATGIYDKRTFECLRRFIYDNPIV